MYLTWPRPCLLRPPFLRLNVCNTTQHDETASDNGKTTQTTARRFVEGRGSEAAELTMVAARWGGAQQSSARGGSRVAAAAWEGRRPWSDV
jgi:hypothetical protein